MRLGTITKAESITQTQIDELKTLHDTLDAMKRRYDRLKVVADTKEQILIAKVEQGARIKCREQVTVKTTERRFPPWKEAFLSKLGQAEAIIVIGTTPKTIYKALIISEAA